MLMVRSKIFSVGQPEKYECLMTVEAAASADTSNVSVLMALHRLMIQDCTWKLPICAWSPDSCTTDSTIKTSFSNHHLGKLKTRYALFTTLLVRCSVFNAVCCVAVHCSALRCVAVRCGALQCVTVCCSVLQCVAVCCSVL